MRLLILASILSLTAPAMALAQQATPVAQPALSEADYRDATLRFRQHMANMTGEMTLARTPRDSDRIVAFYQPEADAYAALAAQHGNEADARRARNLPRATAIRVRSQMLFRSQIGVRSDSPADLGRRITD
jgi:hypothetical protein